MEDKTIKLKLIKIIDLLRQESDEQHPWDTYRILDYLNSLNIQCDRRTLANDIAALNEAGYEIMSCRMSKRKGYYIEDRSFSLPELKILMDSVQAASFITEKKTRELTDKIAALAGSNRAEILKSNMVVFNTRKHSNESVYYNVDFLEDAIIKRCKVSFLYYDLDEKGQKAYRKEKERYIVEPLFLIYVEDKYYLMTWNSKYENITNYRIDRMESVEIEEENISEEAENMINKNSASKYTDKIFQMYSGESVDVTLKFPKNLIGVIYDQFGEKVQIKKIDDNEFFVTVPVMVSPPFYGWVFQFKGQMKIYGPDNIKKEYEEYIKA